MEKSVVTPSCNTAVIALVIYEISPSIIFDPKLYNIAIPILPSKNIGTIYESLANINTIKQSTTAINTYAVIS